MGMADEVLTLAIQNFSNKRIHAASIGTILPLPSVPYTPYLIPDSNSAAFLHPRLFASFDAVLKKMHAFPFIVAYASIYSVKFDPML
jgi:hypothetical protein